MSLAPERLETVLVKPHFISYLIMVVSFEEASLYGYFPVFTTTTWYMHAGTLVLHDQFQHISSFL